jgi:hypothetical protein
MRNSILVICALCTLIFTSCKKDTPKTEEPVADKKVENVIVLSKYSDNNWKSGVAVDLNMFLVDNTEKNLELVKKSKKFVFADGTFATITGFKEQEGFIQVNTLEKASTFNQAAYPFEITVE